MKKAPKHTRAGRKIVAALQAERTAYTRGEVRTIRTIDLPDEPGVYPPEAVVKLRDTLGVSQAVFARLLGISTVLVSHVEQGRREPNQMMRRMLDLMRADPSPWLAMVKPRAKAV